MNEKRLTRKRCVRLKALTRKRLKKRVSAVEEGKEEAKDEFG
jgi:hypothetical protein